MNVTSIITVDYENIANCKLCENKPNSNPTCPGVASCEAGTYHGVASGEAGTCRGVASGEAGTCRGVASGEAGTKPISNQVLL